MLQKISRLALVMMLFTISYASIASSTSTAGDETTKTTSTNNSIRAEQLMFRLNEIKAMDKSSMTRLEKKTLRKEVKEIKKEMKANNGVYLSIGAIIIIVLLLVLLL